MSVPLDTTASTKDAEVKVSTDDTIPPNAYIIKHLESVKERILLAHHKCLSNPSINSPTTNPRLVAVSKTKPVEMIVCAYEQGQRHFGENYVQDLVVKSQDPLLVDLDICWHFIGHLQRNKCNNLAACPHLWAVETVDSERLASSINASWGKMGYDKRLSIFVQVNTSGESSKHGSASDAVIDTVRHVINSCNHLEFLGFMTIGRTGHDYSIGPNPDFECLVQIRKEVCDELGLSMDKVELSMGMSSDFEQAIYSGSTNVRVGSEIFGSRETKR